jgi:hypothetical protein
MNSPVILNLCETWSLTLTAEQRLRVGKPEIQRPLGRLSHRWMDNIKMDLREIGYGCMDRIILAHDRDQWGALVNMEMNLQGP